MTDWLWTGFLPVVAVTAKRELMMKARHGPAPNPAWFPNSCAGHRKQRKSGAAWTSSTATVVVERPSRNGSTVSAFQFYHTDQTLRCQLILPMRSRSSWAYLAWNAVPRRMTSTPTVRITCTSCERSKKRVSVIPRGRSMRLYGCPSGYFMKELC